MSDLRDTNNGSRAASERSQRTARKPDLLFHLRRIGITLALGFVVACVIAPLSALVSDDPFEWSDVIELALVASIGNLVLAPFIERRNWPTMHRPERAPLENLVRESPAVRGDSEGWLTLTSDRIVFTPRKPKGKSVEHDLARLRSVRTTTIMLTLKPAIVLMEDDRDEDVVEVPETESWAAEIASRIDSVA